MLTPEHEYMIRVNSLKYADELLEMVEALTKELSFISLRKDDEITLSIISKAESLIKDIKG